VALVAQSVAHYFEKLVQYNRAADNYERLVGAGNWKDAWEPTRLIGNG
jgi:hypothetical protein